MSLSDVILYPALLVFAEKGKITEKNNLFKSNGPWSLIIPPPTSQVKSASNSNKTTLYVYNFVQSKILTW